MTFVALALLPSLALNVPPPTTKRTAALLIPMDQGAEASVIKLESYMDEALDAFPSAVVKKSDELLGLPPDEDAQASLRRAETGYNEGKAAFDAREWEDAERKLRADIKEFHKSAAALKTCGHLCDAIAMYAAVMQTRGDTEEAKLALLDLLALNPTYEFDVKRFGRDFLSLRTQVATGHAASLRGSSTIKTKPAGARVYVDGEFLGFSPATLNAAGIGKHLLRIERPGFKVWGQMLDITPEDAELQADLKPTSAYKAYDGEMDKIASEVNRDKGGPAIQGAGRQFGLDRALIGTVKEISESGALEILLGVFDTHTGKKLAGKRTTFQGDEYGQLKSEIARLVNSVMNAAEGNNEKVAKSSDPLETKHGMEEWGGEEKGGKTEDGSKNRKKDPLDGVNGTEDW